MKKFILILFFINLISCNKVEPKYFIYNTTKITEKQEDFIEKDLVHNFPYNSLFKLIKNKSDIKDIYRFLIKKNLLIGIAIYIYKENDGLFVDSIWMQFLGEENYALSLYFSFSKSAKLDDSKYLLDVNNKNKIEYIINKIHKNRSYYYELSKITIVWFPDEL